MLFWIDFSTKSSINFLSGTASFGCDMKWWPLKAFLFNNYRFTSLWKCFNCKCIVCNDSSYHNNWLDGAYHNHLPKLTCTAEMTRQIVKGISASTCIFLKNHKVFLSQYSFVNVYIILSPSLYPISWFGHVACLAWWSPSLSWSYIIIIIITSSILLLF